MNQKHRKKDEERERESIETYIFPRKSKQWSCHVE